MSNNFSAFNFSPSSYKENFAQLRTLFKRLFDVESFAYLYGDEGFWREDFIFDFASYKLIDGKPIWLRPLFEKAFSGNEIIYIADAKYEEQHQDIYRLTGYRSLLLMPIQVDYAPGYESRKDFQISSKCVLNLNSYEPNKFSGSDRFLIRVLGEMFETQNILSFLSSSFGNYAYAMISSLPMGFIIVRHNGLSLANDESRRLLGLPPVENFEAGYTEVFPDEQIFPNGHKTGLAEKLQQLRRHKIESEKIEFWHQRPDGNRILLSCRLKYLDLFKQQIPVFGDEESEIHLAVIMDITQQREQANLKRDLEISHTIQKGLFPKKPPQLERFDIYGLSRPVYQVGGDYYDFIKFDDDLGILLADVAGKGIPAAILMSNLQASIRTMANLDLPGLLRNVFCQYDENGEAHCPKVGYDYLLPFMINHMNALICGNTALDQFVTMFFAILEKETGILHYVNAGHNPIILLHADGKVDYLESNNLILGYLPDIEFKMKSVQLLPGDLLFLYSDGVTEAFSSEQEEFGEGRLVKFLQKYYRESAQKICRTLMKRLEDFQEEQSDDTTMVAVKVKL